MIEQQWMIPDTRIIEALEDGTYFGSTVRMTVHDKCYDEYDQLLHIDVQPNVLYEIIRAGIVKLSGQQGASQENKALAKLLKVALKGILIAYGPQLLKALLGPEHPRMPKGEDMLAWYTDIFTQVAISYCMKNDIVLEGKGLPFCPHAVIIEVNAIDTRPVSPGKEDAVGSS